MKRIRGRRPATLPVAVIAVVALSAGGCAPPSAEEAERFVVAAEERLVELGTELERTSWVQSTYITDDTEILAARANERYIEATVELAKEAGRFAALDLPPEVARKLALLRLALTLPAPANAEQRAELTRIAARMEGVYGKGKYCPPGGECMNLGELSQIMATSRDAEELERVWVGWRQIAPPLKPDYVRFVELGNAGARELGFDDLGALWRAKYDMPPDDFVAEVDRLWHQVRPLYEALHCYVRRRLNETYGDAVAPAEGPIPAHLLGNMWAQTWGNIYPLAEPPGADPGFDVTRQLAAKGLDERAMVKQGERFFTSLGFAPLPETFWRRSMFTKPADREVVCHASAWNIDQQDDLRIKMCIEINEEDLSTIHHELGHSFYQRAYKTQPPLFRDGANDGFHEGVGDTIALSVTPGYLVEIGLLDAEPPAGADLGVLMRRALDKVAFLPFGLLIDRWRWAVFSGEVTPDEYNAFWWQLRRQYQGVRPPVERSELDFDPGAKYHVPANTPYTRYFLAHILQFQFQRALCKAAGYEGDLHRCSIYGNQQAGRRLIEMLELGASRPWPEALEALSGETEMDATAIIDYFQPLMSWLEERNRGSQCGW